MMKKIILILLIGFFACKRERVLEVNSNFQGVWIHYSTNNDYHIISIESDGRGYMEYYENNDFDHDTQDRRWFIKNDALVFGRMTARDEKFIINLMPTIATTDFISNYDTVFTGQKFMVLNGKTYVALL